MFPILCKRQQQQMACSEGRRLIPDISSYANYVQTPVGIKYIIVNCTCGKYLQPGQMSKNRNYPLTSKKSWVTEALSLQLFSLAMQVNTEEQIIKVCQCPSGEQGAINEVKAGVSCN